MNYLNHSIKDIKQLGIDRHEEYLNATPFPNIVIDNFFDEEMLSKVAEEFPDLSKFHDVKAYDNQNEKYKLEAKGERHFSETGRLLAHYLNSEPVLQFLQELTGIKETLIPDPYFAGGGYHEIKPGGLLKVHADFNKHEFMRLDRRINLLVYLNKEWEESFGGNFELWDRDMKKAYKKVLPVFNRVAIFSTTDFSYHGHPDPLTCPPDRSRKSLALYYYTNGRPKSELNPKAHATLFVDRAGIKGDTEKEPITLKSVVADLVPPILLKAAKKIIRRD